MLDYVGCKNQIEAVIAERQCADVAQLDLAKSFFRTESNCLTALVYAAYVDKAKVTKHPKVSASAGADIEDVGILGETQGLDNIRKEQPSANVPPMVRFDCRFYGVSSNIHNFPMTRKTIKDGQPYLGFG